MAHCETESAVSQCAISFAETESMPSTSIKQQHLFGAALGVKRGHKSSSAKINKLASSMPEKKLREFAKKIWK